MPTLTTRLGLPLRGIGQVIFQNNPITGALFLTGIAITSPWFGLATLLGSIASTLTASLLKKPVQDGLYGFNGALSTLALVVFLGPSPEAFFYGFLASILSTPVMMSTEQLLTPWKLPSLTFPFVLITLIFLSALSFVWPHPPATPTAITQLPLGSLHGISQIFLIENPITAAFFLAGLFISSRSAASLALMGTIIGSASSLIFSHPGLAAGLFGFNGALTAIALGSVFGKASCKRLPIILIAIFASTLLTLAGIPLTLPFVLCTWGALLAERQTS